MSVKPEDHTFPVGTRVRLIGTIVAHDDEKIFRYQVQIDGEDGEVWIWDRSGSLLPAPETPSLEDRIAAVEKRQMEIDRVMAGWTRAAQELTSQVRTSADVWVRMYGRKHLEELGADMRRLKPRVEQLFTVNRKRHAEYRKRFRKIEAQP